MTSHLSSHSPVLAGEALSMDMLRLRDATMVALPPIRLVLLLRLMMMMIALAMTIMMAMVMMMSPLMS